MKKQIHHLCFSHVYDYIYTLLIYGVATLDRNNELVRLLRSREFGFPRGGHAPEGPESSQIVDWGNWSTLGINLAGQFRISVPMAFVVDGAMDRYDK